jgi:hypothetical protein
MKYQYHGLMFVAGVSIVSSLLVTAIKSAVNPYQLVGLAGLLVILGMLVFAVRDPNSVSDVLHFPASHVRMYAVFSLLLAIAISVVTYA